MSSSENILFLGLQVEHPDCPIAAAVSNDPIIRIEAHISYVRALQESHNYTPITTPVNNKKKNKQSNGKCLLTSSAIV